MSNAFTRSWEITKLSFNVMKADKELFLFPVVGGIFSMLFVITMLFPVVITSLLQEQGIVTGGLFYLIIFMIYFGLAFIATFFNVCVVYTTKTRFDGGNATFMDSIRFAFSRIHLIAAWSLLSATVGLILRLLDNLAERMGTVGEIIMKIVISLLGAAWSIVTIFVVPGMVYNDLGPFSAIKNSIDVLKKTWGESLVRMFSLGIMQFLFYVVGIAAFIGLLFVLPTDGIVVVGLIILAVLYLVAVTLVFSVMNAIFNTALYAYAKTGKVPSGFSNDAIQGAFTGKSAQPQI
jgi:hypothetical protein